MVSTSAGANLEHDSLLSLVHYCFYRLKLEEYHRINIKNRYTRETFMLEAMKKINQPTKRKQEQKQNKTKQTTKKDQQQMKSSYSNNHTNSDKLSWADSLPGIYRHFKGGFFFLSFSFCSFLSKLLVNFLQ